MARNHAQVKTAIWADDDFRTLSVAGQHLYFVLLTSDQLNYCGVTDWRPSRLAAYAGGWTREAVETAALELHHHRYIVVDASTEEVLIRSFIRNDGLLDQPNVATAMARQYAHVASAAIRGVLVHELQRLFGEDPSRKGWEKASDLLERPSVDPSVNPSGWGSVYPSPYPSIGVNGTLPVTQAPLPSPFSLLPNSLLPTTSEVADAPSDPDDSSDDVPPVVEGRDDVERICVRLADRMVDNGCKRPAITNRWREAARLMLDRDGRTEVQVNNAIDWCQNDTFWKGNIHSIPKLRDQYDKLRQAAARGGKSNVTPVDFGTQPKDPKDRPLYAADDVRARWTK